MSEPDSLLAGRDDCGCGAGLGAQTPLALANRSGLSAITYRIGTHSEFKASMLAALSASTQPALRALQTREDDDFSIALLDACATLADVLTFYQERIANESYLRTATERRSLVELGALVGYRLRPGVAAGTCLAFTIEGAPGATGVASLDVGVKAQSVPGPGQQAQIFETVEKLEARAAWNVLRPRLTRRQLIDADSQTVLLSGITTGLKAGDGLLLLHADGNAARFCIVTAVVVHADGLPEQRYTEVRLQAAAQEALALPPGLQSQDAAEVGPVSSQFLGKTVNAADFQATAEVQKFHVADVLGNFTATAAPAASALAFRVRGAIFGHNAPDWRTLPLALRYKEKRPAEGGGEELVNGPFRFPSEDWVDWPTIYGTFDIRLDRYPGSAGTDHIFLDQAYSGVVTGSWLVLRNPQTGKARCYQAAATAELTKANFTLTAKVLRVRLDPDADLGLFAIRNTVVYAQSEALSLARAPIVAPVSGKLIELNGFAEGLPQGRVLIICGELQQQRGTRACELAVVNKVEHVLQVDGYTQLELTAELRHAYVRDTVTINANVARATHGETAQEVLGSGDAALGYQRFTLRQPPLTHVSAANASGTASTLQVRVNDLLWHEVPSLYGQGPEERIYVARLGDDGKTTVVFGDGRTGARLPSGAENVRAIYRKGIGRGGLVDPEQISVLLTRPLGVTAVINPLASLGADDAEILETVRDNAPLTVMTLERIVSLRDYEDFARAYAGITKARATWTWNGQRRGVFVTVAGPGGAGIEAGSDLYKNLLAAMRAAGDPYVPLRVQTYRPAFFRLAARIKVHPDHLAGQVVSATEQALRKCFAFTARQFGQPVALSEVIAVMQAVPGVTAVDVDKLHRFDAPPTLQPVLVAAAPQTGDKGTVAAAELLLLDPAPLHDLGVMP
jgi:predicted phage baseplate assembly protein